MAALIKIGNWLLFLYIMIILSMVLELRLFMSQAVIWLLLTAIFTFRNSTFPFFTFSKAIKENLLEFWKYKAFSVVIIFFLFVLLSGLWTPPNDIWLSKLRVRLPFLAMPFIFAWLPVISKKDYRLVFYIMILVISVVSVGILINYVLNFEVITESLRHGKNIPVPMNHIRFSLILGFSICAGVLLYLDNFYLRYIWERKLILGLSIFLFLTIHILSVRSGIVALYGTFSVLGFRYYIVKKKEYVKGLILGASLLVIPIIAYLSLPSLQNKVKYSIYDYQQFKAGNGADFSDSERFGSILVGMDIGNRYPFLGCGYGNIEKEISLTYQRVFPQENEYKIPHNQFVMTYATTGIVGVLILIFTFFFPIFYRKNYRDWFFLAFHCIIFCSLLVESTLETQVGALMYTFFLCLGLNSNKKALSNG
ncbi:MAG: O-antigen ligase family protein [Saprospiraceae bacterium]